MAEARADIVPRRSNRRRGLVAVTTIVLAATALVACGDDSDSEASSGGDDVTIEDVWARTSAGDQANGAAYMVINAGAEDDRLVAASVPADIAARTEIHETVTADEGEMDMEGSTDGTDMADGDTDMEGSGGDGEMEGMQGMTMQEVDGIVVPAGEVVTLEPGGFHVMMLDLADPLEAGQSFDLTLTFEIAGERTVTAEVRDA